MDIGKEWLEAVLRRKAYEESPVRVLEVKSSSVVGKGDNYLSSIERLRAKVLLGSGKVKNFSVIVKNQHATEAMKKFSVQLGIFHKEITMYRDVLPMMEVLLEEANDTDDLFWARCYDIRLYDRLVFEDLAASGYRMANRRKQLGLNAALLVLKHLAKFHALSRVLLDRGDIPDVCKDCAWLKNPDFAKISTNENMGRLAEAVGTWGDDWKGAVERLTKAQHTLGEKMLEALISEPDEFTVLCHADCWTNNLMFKGDDLEQPTSMKFLDLQMSYIGSPALDLHYFLVTSVRLEVREKELDNLVRTYHEHLKSFLLKFGHEGVPTLDELNASLKKRAVMPLLNSTMASFMANNTDDMPELEEMFEKEMKALERGEKSGFNQFIGMDDLPKNVISAALKEAIESGVI